MPRHETVSTQRRLGTKTERRTLTERIQTKRVYEAPNVADGYRILVDRVWPRGMTKERMRVNRWLKSIAPSTELRTWFNHDPSKWKGFKKRYYVELGEHFDGVRELCDAIARGTITLIYSAKDRKHNQAIALKEYILTILNR